MAELVPIFTVSVLSTVLSVPLAIRLALAIRFLDLTGGHKSHEQPTPLLGGLALGLGSAAGCAVFFRGTENTAAVAAAALLMAVGLVDDLRDLSVAPKLIGQAVACGVFLVFAPRSLEQLDWSTLVVVAFWILAMSNSFNLLDNHDGVAATLGVTTATGLIGVALAFGESPPLAAVAIAGACFGFLFYNRPPARIFMGDAGSLPLGFGLAVIAMPLVTPVAVRATALGCLFAVPILDTSLVVISRSRRGLNPLTTPGRDHLAHRLHDLGLGSWSALLIIGGGSALLASMAVAVAAERIPPTPVAVTLALSWVVAIAFLERMARPADG